MKLRSQSMSLLLVLGIGQQVAAAMQPQSAESTDQLMDQCCRMGKQKAAESASFACKISASDVVSKAQQQVRVGHLQQPHLLAALVEGDANVRNQCEMVAESCCLSHHRARNCQAGKQLARSGAACMDVELSKEATVATESFNDCCMSCSLGVLAARSPAPANHHSISSNQHHRHLLQTNNRQNDTSANKCKLLSPLASSLAGQLYEQTYVECCQENLPRTSGALKLDPGAPVECGSASVCAHKCLPAGSLEPAGNNLRRVLERDTCDCFSGYRLAPDGINCVDVDECKLNLHTCNKQSEVCDNTRGSFRCLARRSSSFSSSSLSSSSSSSSSSSLSLSSLSSSSSMAVDLSPLSQSIRSSSLSSPSSSPPPPPPSPSTDEFESEFVSTRLCPLGSKWHPELNRCRPTSNRSSPTGAAGEQRSASLHALITTSSSRASASQQF